MYTWAQKENKEIKILDQAGQLKVVPLILPLTDQYILPDVHFRELGREPSRKK